MTTTTAPAITSRQLLNQILDKHNITSFNIVDVPGDGWNIDFYREDDATVLLFSEWEEDYDSISQPLMDLIGDICGDYSELSGVIKRVTLMGDPAFQFTGNVTQSFVTQLR